jgi:hypothetical protein
MQPGPARPERAFANYCRSWPGADPYDTSHATLAPRFPTSDSGVRRCGLSAGHAGHRPSPGRVARVTTLVKLDNFGYRPDDIKLAIFTTNPGATVQVQTPAKVANRFLGRGPHREDERSGVGVAPVRCCDAQGSVQSRTSLVGNSSPPSGNCSFRSRCHFHSAPPWVLGRLGLSRSIGDGRHLSKARACDLEPCAGSDALRKRAARSVNRCGPPSVGQGLLKMCPYCSSRAIGYSSAFCLNEDLMSAFSWKYLTHRGNCARC